eukprot:179234-Pyramimonas_sp.AAC.1
MVAGGAVAQLQGINDSFGTALAVIIARLADGRGHHRDRKGIERREKIQPQLPAQSRGVNQAKKTLHIHAAGLEGFVILELRERGADVLDQGVVLLVTRDLVELRLPGCDVR